MKKDHKKLSPTDYTRMWGEDGPYSQVRLCEETRILHEGVSRVFLVVEAEINPFTFEYVRVYRRKFAGDEAILQLLDHAEYRGKFGYVVSAGEVEIVEEGAHEFARRQADMTVQTLIRMHAFVMREFGLEGNGGFAVMEDDAPHDGHLVWDEKTERIEAATGVELWDDKTLIQVSAGMRDNTMRFFVAFAFTDDFEFKKESAEAFARTLKKVAEDFRTSIENCEIFMGYVLITALLPLDVAPADFIEIAREACNGLHTKPMFAAQYLVTNVKRPTPDQIAAFLKTSSLQT